MAQWSINVGNIGNVFDSTNGFQAYREFGQWKEHASAEHGRASGETVTLMRDGEPVREFSPNAGFFFAEVTDTYGGEANYCWARRYKIRANNMRGAINKLSRAEGYSFRQAYDTGDGARYDARRACVCAFLDWFDAQKHSDYSNVKTI